MLIFPQVDRDKMASTVLGMLQATSEACPTNRSGGIGGPSREGIPEAVLAKEAAYNAVGVGSWDLFDHLDFTSWLRSSLLPVSINPSSLLLTLNT